MLIFGKSFHILLDNDSLIFSPSLNFIIYSIRITILKFFHASILNGSSGETPRCNFTHCESVGREISEIIPDDSISADTREQHDGVSSRTGQREEPLFNPTTRSYHLHFRCKRGERGATRRSRTPSEAREEESFLRRVLCIILRIARIIVPPSRRCYRNVCRRRCVCFVVDISIRFDGVTHAACVSSVKRHVGPRATRRENGRVEIRWICIREREREGPLPPSPLPPPLRVAPKLGDHGTRVNV